MPSINKKEFLDRIIKECSSKFSFSVGAKLEDAPKNFQDPDVIACFKITYLIEDRAVGSELYTVEKGDDVSTEKNSTFQDLKNFLSTKIAENFPKHRIIRPMTYLDRPAELKIGLIQD